MGTETLYRGVVRGRRLGGLRDLERDRVVLRTGLRERFLEDEDVEAEAAEAEEGGLPRLLLLPPPPPPPPPPLLLLPPRSLSRLLRSRSLLLWGLI